MKARRIEIFDEPIYAIVTMLDGRQSVDEPVYDENDPENQPETLSQYMARMASEFECTNVYTGYAPYDADTRPDPHKQIGKSSHKQGATMRYSVHYADNSDEPIRKAQWDNLSLPIVEYEP